MSAVRQRDGLLIEGEVHWVLTGPDGKIKSEGSVKNLVTASGDRLYASRGAGLSTFAAPTGMRLGTGTTTPSKTGAGAAIVAYLTGSNKAFDATFPAEAGGVVTYTVTWGPGVATTASPINEVVINNDTITNNNSTTATVANTIARALITGVDAKGAADTLKVIWTHTLAGS